MQQARLRTVSYQKLHRQSEDELLKLYQACCEDGFFYMDLRGAGGDVNKVTDAIFALEKELFTMPDHEKLKYDIDLISPRKLNGYKPVGRNRGEISGRQDGFESYALPKDGIMSLSKESFQRPAVIDYHLPDLRAFCSIASAATSVIMSSLSLKLQVTNDQRLEDMHRTHLPTPDLIRLLKYCSLPASEPGKSHIAHTDLGSLTILFSKQPGLQVQRSKETGWEAVEPRQGYAIVNLGDSLTMLSGGLFKSALHCVASPIAGAARAERYSFAYFCRAEDNVSMKAVSSPLITAKTRDSEVLTSAEWIQRKYKALRGQTWNVNNDSLLTGGR